ncbi:MAG TPA: hypothetical protein VKQ32_11315 [Polyangia bacterium]|nr:hypothetical protein [Polyangia bacterium]
MRTARLLSLIAAAAVLSWTMPARAQVATSLSTAAAVVPGKGPPHLGVMADAGAPDGANGSLVFRPFSWLRAHGGGGTNMISKGVRVGATLLPFGSGPSATLEAGHYFDGDANGLAQRFAGSTFSSPLLQRLGYDYVNAHLGLDVGSGRVVFYIHGGMSYIRATIHNFGSVVAGAATENGANGSTEVSVKADPIVKAWVPSAKLGLIVYLW